MPVQRSPAKQNADVVADKIDCYCLKPDNVCMVECYLCNRFRHYECMGIPIKDISACVVLGNDGVFICKSCVPRFDAGQRDTLFSDCPTAQVFSYDLAAEIPVPSAAPSTASTPRALTQDDLKSIIETATAAAVKAATEGMFDLMEEFLQRREKRMNLVIVGWPEKEPSDRSQRTADLAKVHQYCEGLDIDKDSVDHVFRDGQKRPQGRIMKVCFKPGFSLERTTFLSRAGVRMKHDGDFHGMQKKPFVRPDYTTKQRDLNFQLMEQCRAKRAESGDDSWVVRDFKIVKKSKKSVLINQENQA